MFRGLGVERKLVIQWLCKQPSKDEGCFTVICTQRPGTFDLGKEMDMNEVRASYRLMWVFHFPVIIDIQDAPSNSGHGISSAGTSYAQACIVVPSGTSESSHRLRNLLWEASS